MFILGKRLINLLTSVRKQFSMPAVSSEDLKQLEANLDVGGKLIYHLKGEIKQLMSTAQKHKEHSKIKALKEKNKALVKEINIVKADLIKLQVANGVLQIPIPGHEEEVTSEGNFTQAGEASDKAVSSENALSSETISNESKPAKAVKAKKPIDDVTFMRHTEEYNKKFDSNVKQELKSNCVNNNTDETSHAELIPVYNELGEVVEYKDPPNFGQLDIRVGLMHLLSRHPNPDKNVKFVETVTIGGKEDDGTCDDRQVESGVPKLYCLEELRMVKPIIICNPMPITSSRGFESTIVVLCARKGKKIQLLSAPEDATTGDHVIAQGYNRLPELPYAANIFSNILKNDLRVNDKKQVEFKGVPLKVQDSEGYITARTFKNCPVGLVFNYTGV